MKLSLTEELDSTGTPAYYFYINDKFVACKIDKKEALAQFEIMVENNRENEKAKQIKVIREVIL